ncbi:uncharacterized protein LOC112452507 [Temnothorax curvispinosus]|uniref:Uncharacterized protein LOC112452507 n=1 Tax=Temnothorax curvispinosus TaxID=300111 RepID=A0A6J1PG29_9HYME|nr:uncharacterized protein LOC112452507 [Temnothorax curvispinosus]
MHANSQGRTVSNNSNTSPPTGEKTPVLPCDEESSFASVDDVFFFCEQQPTVNQETYYSESFKKTRSKDEYPNAEGNSKKSNVRSENKNSKKDSSTCTKDKGQNKIAATDCHNFQLNHTGKIAKKHTYLPKNLKNPFAHSQKNIVHRSLKNSFGQNQKKTDSQRTHTTLIDILVEDCRQCAIGEKSVASFSNVSDDVKKDITDCRGTLTQPTEKKSPGSRFKYNCIESALDSINTNKDSRQRYYNKISIVDNITKLKKPDATHAKTTEITKKFPWNCTCTKTKRNLDKCKEQEKNDSIESFDSYNDAKQLKKKKPACSPLKKFGRSSLSVGADKIAINLPKYSPCASRLAASSKILSSDRAADPESPLHVPRSRSPSHIDVQTENNLSKHSEKTSIQASLSLNIQQFQKTRYTLRSRSVGDSCVTSPTSEATTVSYSPTGTEILSLEEVGPHTSHTSSAEGSGSSYSEVKEKLDAECSDKVRRATLETKC